MASKSEVPGTEEGTQQPEGSGTSLRKTVPVPKNDGTVGYQPVPQPEGPQVRYVGMATRRILTPVDWERVGVDDTEHKTFVWDLTNAKQIDRSEFSEKQLEYLRSDDRFEVEGD